MQDLAQRSHCIVISIAYQQMLFYDSEMDTFAALFVL
jgi:hypothetical protein